MPPSTHKYIKLASPLLSKLFVADAFLPMRNRADLLEDICLLNPGDYDDPSRCSRITFFRNIGLEVILCRYTKACLCVPCIAFHIGKPCAWLYTCIYVLYTICDLSTDSLVQFLIPSLAVLDEVGPHRKVMHGHAGELLPLTGGLGYSRTYH